MAHDDNTTLVGILIIVLLITAFMFALKASAFRRYNPEIYNSPAVENVDEDAEDIESAISKAHNTPNSIYVPVVYDLSTRSYEQISTKVKHITAYNAVPNQTNAHPFTMASNRSVYEGAVAISQDIIDKYKLKFGDIVYIPALDNYYIFEDKMAYGRKTDERIITETIDIFMYSYDEAKKFHLKDNNVILFKISRNQ